jgi:hypothetical protein
MLRLLLRSKYFQRLLATLQQRGSGVNGLHAQITPNAKMCFASKIGVDVIAKE